MKIRRETETGSIVSFDYDNEIAEITGLTTSFEPKQDGTPWMAPTVDTAPYLLRQSPDLDHEYNSEIDTLVGRTIAWNQLVKNDETTSTSTGITFTKNNDGSWTVAGTFSERTYKYISTINLPDVIHAGDVYYASTGITMPTGANLNFDFRSSSAYISGTVINAGRSYRLLKIPDGATVLGRPYIDVRDLSAGASVNFTIKPLFVNLTRIFGTEIADYVYSLEQSTSGSGIAWLKSYGFLTKDYYAYNYGSLVSVKTSEHRTTGKNLLPKGTNRTTNGITFTVNDDGSVTVTGTATASAFWAVQFTIPQGSYSMNGCPSGGGNSTYLIDVRNGVGGSGISGIGGDNGNGSNFTLSEPLTAYLNIRIANGYSAPSGGLTLYPMIRFADVSDAAFEPYTVHSYPLDSDLELRGIPKLSNGSLYYDGDEYQSSGTVTRKYGIVDLGTLDWTRETPTNPGIPLFKANVSGRKKGSSNILCQKYVTVDIDRTYLASVATGIASWNSSNATEVAIKDDSYTDATSFTTAMSGIYLVYEKASVSTETADSFTSPQIVDPNGTEEYVDTRDVPVPVGHRTSYADIYPISGLSEAKVYVNSTNTTSGAKVYTLNLNGTRYGGTIDFFSGVMTLNMVDVDLGSLAWSVDSGLGAFITDGIVQTIKKPSSNSEPMSALCELYPIVDRNHLVMRTICANMNGRLCVKDDLYASASSFKSAMSGVQLVYELAEPIEVQLTAEQIEALQGQNNVWANCGDITLSWLHAPVLSEAVKLNGKYIELIVDGYTTLGTSGRRSLERDLTTYSVGTADGETVKNSIFPSRVITVDYVIQTDTEEELTDAINQLANILNQDECDFVFRDESDKFFSGYSLFDSEPKKYRNAIKGSWSIYCAYPFKRSVKPIEISSLDGSVATVGNNSATFVFDYNGALPAHPVLRAEFASAKSGGEYNEDGDCGYVAFLDPDENIIQLGNPEILDTDQYANETLINREFDTLSGWTANGISVGNITDQFWEQGKGQTQSYAKGTGSLVKSVGNGATNMEFDIVHRLCVSAANQTGKFECYAKNGNTIIVGFKIEKTGSGTSGTVSYIVNNRVVGTDAIDLSYYNTHFGYCNRTAVYGTVYESVYESYYVKKKKKKKKKKWHWVTYPRTVQTGWSYTQSNLNSGWSKDGSVIVFSVGNLADRTFKSADIEFTPSTSVEIAFTGNMHTNAIHSCAMLSKAGVPFAEIPNVFTSGDVVEGDCNSADVTLYRKGSAEGHLEPQYGALGNNWEDFEIKPGRNIIRAVWSDWVNTNYKPVIKIIFNEVYL